MLPRILALDTATEACSVAFFNKNHTTIKFKMAFRKHSEVLLPLIEEVLQAEKIDVNKLDALAVNRGPGSFTGVRVGIGIAQGLALGAELPIIVISSLAIMAQGAWRQTSATHVLVAMTARVGEIYWAEYQRNNSGYWQGKETETILSLELVKLRLISLSGKWSVVGNAWKIYPQLLTLTNVTFILTNIVFSLAEDMISLALDAWEHKEISCVDNVQPVYYM